MEIIKLATVRHNTNTFGGKIYISDFSTEHCNGNTAQRIVSDWKFDEQCRKNRKMKRKES